MEPIKLNNLNDIATIVKSNYADMLHKMHFVFGVRNGENKFFIFQELFGVPIERFVYHKSNSSVTFVAGWGSWTNPNSLVADANNEMIENYKDLLDRSRPYNGKKNKLGVFNSSNWIAANRQNKKERRKKHKEKVDTFFEFRIENIDRAIFSRWGFELYSPVLSMIAVNSKRWFPYQIEGASPEDPPLTPLGYNALITEFKWSGKSFDILIQNDTQTPSNWSEIGSHPDGLLSYWDSNISDKKNDEFDEEIAEVLLDDEEKDDMILNVGQRDVNLIL